MRPPPEEASLPAVRRGSELPEPHPEGVLVIFDTLGFSNPGMLLVGS